MHPTLTFDLIQQDHRERVETARLLALRASRRSERGRPAGASRGRPPDPARRGRVPVPRVARHARAATR